MSATTREFSFRHFPELDGLRGIAILLVIVGHVLEKHYRIATDLGELGVLLFFVLSGFLITGLLDREQASTGTIALRAFYTRRVLRIFPAFLAYIAVVSLLIPAGVVNDTPWYSVAAAVLFVHNIWGRGDEVGHLWSLSLEEQFYAVWPWTMKRVGGDGALRIAVWGSLAITLFRMICIHMRWMQGGFSDVYLYRPWFRFDAVLIGCAAVLWLGRSQSTLRSRRWLGSVVVPIVGWPALVWWTLHGNPAESMWFITVQTCLAAIVLVNVVVCRTGSVPRIFRASLLRWIGRISYSWYLWQQLFTFSDLTYPIPAWSGWAVLKDFPLNVITSLAVAIVSYYIVEKPFLRLKDRLRAVAAARRPAVA